MRDFIGVRDTAVYDMLRAGRLVYVSLLLQKPQLVARAERPRDRSRRISRDVAPRSIAGTTP